MALRSLTTLSWAVYLGCSWTWCIGMFLPVILVSEYGRVAWFVFAVPNVLGAAAMAWVLSRPESSETIVTTHRTACIAFTVVTLAFHAHFLIWLWTIPTSFVLAAILGGSICGFIVRKNRRFDLVFAWMVLCVSLAVLCRGLTHFTVGDNHGIYSDRAPVALACLAPICCFGFFLCPYLDLTFHRARQELDDVSAKWAFGIGFGVVFLAMIFLTLMYEGDFAADRTWADHFGSFGGYGLVTWVVLHMAAQSGFTWSAHLRTLPRFQKKDILLWIAGMGLVAAAVFFERQQMWFDSLHRMMLTGDAIYRIFMAFYGLIFPAYVWICMMPLGRTPRPMLRALIVWMVAIAIAAPMFWMGFILERMIWLLPGLAVVLVAKLFARSSGGTVEIQS